MHFSIPDVQELYAESTGSTYIAYNIYINGSYHACLRYKQLHALHEQLRRRCTELGVQLPLFPPKRLLPLTNCQLETRRAALEHYLQLVGQDGVISRLEDFQRFLLNAQLETALAEGVLDDWCDDSSQQRNGVGLPADYKRPVSLEVVLANGYQLQVNCRLEDNANALLAKTFASLQLSPELLPYFCLFLVRREARDSLVLLRKLMDFEAPFVSRLHAQPCQIQLRKSYWSPVYDTILMQQPIGLNLLFMQTVTEVEREWILAPPETLQKLHSLQERGLKREYMEMARQLPLYGCLQFAPAQVDYPEPQTTSVIAIGNKELSMRTTKEAKIFETKFRVTRMRCWRVTAIHNTQEAKDAPSNLQLSFEYLMSKQTLRWITITSPQAMLISVCLQSMVDELLNCTNSEKSAEAEHGYTSAATTPTYLLLHSDGGSNQSTPVSSSSSTPTSATSTSSTSSTPSSPTAPVRFLTTKRLRSRQHPKVSNCNSYAAVFFRNVGAQHESVHNEAFEGIGDDDL